MNNLKENLIETYGLKLGIFVSILINEYDKNKQNCSLKEEDFFELKNLTLFSLLSLNKKDIKKFHKYGKEIDAVKVSSINYEKESISQNIMTDKITLEMLTLFSNLIKLESELLSKEKALKTAKENYKIDKKRFEERLISTVNFLNSETQNRKATINLENLLLDYFYSIKQYEAKLI